MKYQTGDLVWIPQATTLYRHNSKEPLAVKVSDKPSFGIIAELKLEGYLEIILNNEKWTVEEKQCKKIIKEKEC